MSAKRTPQLFTILYYLLSNSPPRPPLTRGLGSEADWGRDCSVFSRNIWEYRNIFSPSGPSGHLPHKREAWVSASLHAGGIPHQRESGVSASLHAGGTPHQREACVFCFPPRRWNPHQSKKTSRRSGMFMGNHLISSRVKASQSSTLVGTTILPARMSALACSTAFRASSVSRVVVGAMSTPPSVRLY